MLKLEHVSKTFNPGTINEKIALNDVSLRLAPGDFVTVIGGNGAGKSTLLNAVAGVWPVDRGSILVDGMIESAVVSSILAHVDRPLHGAIKCSVEDSLFIFCASRYFYL